MVRESILQIQLNKFQADRKDFTKKIWDKVQEILTWMAGVLVGAQHHTGVAGIWWRLPLYGDFFLVIITIIITCK